MRLATFNAENLFSRPKIMQYPDWAEGRRALEDFTALKADRGRRLHRCVQNQAHRPPESPTVFPGASGRSSDQAQ